MEEPPSIYASTIYSASTRVARVAVFFCLSSPRRYLSNVLKRILERGAFGEKIPQMYFI